jgi:NitT/TauT family transport system substrate-binding protein
MSVMNSPLRRRLGAVLTAGTLALTVAACGSDSSSSGDTGSGGGSSVEVKLGYFPNLTHATAIVGISKGYFEDALTKDGATLKTLDFSSGSDTIDALLNGDLDATYIGPSPAITAYATSHNVSIVSGVASGGASLMVNKSIKSAADLKGKTLATPGPGNTQDVALKYWLKQHGYKVSPDGQGDVTVVNPDSNSLIVQQFKTGTIAGAWVPEPYASLLAQAGAKTLVDEASLWPHGKFVTTTLLVNDDFLHEHANLVNDLLKGQIKANDYIAKNSEVAKRLTGAYIGKLTGSQIPASALNRAWSKLTFTDNPLADTLLESAKHAEATGLLDPVPGLARIYDLRPLNALLKAKGEPTVPGPSVQ